MIVRFYLLSENKGADQLCGKLNRAFVFAYAKCGVSHDAAHLRKAFGSAGLIQFLVIGYLLLSSQNQNLRESAKLDISILERIILFRC